MSWTRTGDYLVRLVTPAQPAIPAIPAQRILLAAANWDSGAVSIPITEKRGGYKWRVRASTVGAVVGLAANYAGRGYHTIDHGILFRRGTARIFNRGVEGPSLGTFETGDLFIMGRAGGRILVFKNGTIIHSEPSKLAGVFRLAATVYLSGNSVDDAAVAPLELFEFGSGEGVLPQLKSLAVSGGHNIAAGELPRLEGASGYVSSGSAEGVLPRLVSLSSSGPYGEAVGELPRLEGTANSGDLVLRVNFADGVLPYVGGYARGRMRISAVATGVLPGLEGLASDRPTGIARGTLPRIQAFAGVSTPMFGGVLLYSGFSLVASGSSAPVRGLKTRLPGFALRAYGGANLRKALPRMRLVASGTSESVGRAVMRLPRFGLKAVGTTWAVGQARMTWSGYALQAHGGGFAHMRAGQYSLAARGITGSVGRLAVKFGSYRLAARATQESVGRGVMHLPALAMRKRGIARLVGPSFQLIASGGFFSSEQRDAYAVNIATGAVTQYLNFAFDDVLRFGDRFFGIRSDGIFELAGDTDDGAPIVAEVRTFNSDFGQTNVKRVLYAHVVGDVGSDLHVGISANLEPEYTYPTEQVPVAGVQTARAKTGRGLRGTYYSMALANTGGQPFEIHRLEVVIDPTGRLK